MPARSATADAPASASPVAARPGWHQLAIMAALMGFASISTDLYLPAMPVMAAELRGSAGSVAWTVSGYLIGFSLGQLLWGPIGDRYGRRRPVAAGLVLFVIGSAGCALAGGMPAMIGWRVVQALGACASVVLARAMVRDLYAGARAAQMMSTLITIMAVAPLLGPLVGGQVLAASGWRAIFWLLVLLGAATLAALFTIPETLPPDRRRTEPLGRALLGYGTLLRDPAIAAYIGAGGFFYAGMFAFIAGSPFAYVTYYHVSPQAYGLLFALGIAGVMGANLVNARLVARIPSDRLLRWGTFGAAAAGLVLAVTARTGWGGLAGLVLPLFAFASATGFIVANAIAGALGRRPERAGAASALVGAAQYGAGIASSALVGAFADGTPWPMGWVIAASGLGSAFSVQALSRHASRIAAHGELS
jgi:DHA1 family bicyclomycin/chloramphenicol resistance-like MFS transporter